LSRRVLPRGRPRAAQPVLLRALLRASFLALGVVASTTIGGCGEPPVTLVLVAADDLTVPPEFLRLVFRPQGEDPVESEIFPLIALPDNAFAAVTPGLVFSVDVIGCTDNQRDGCETEDTFNARGCRGALVRGRNDPLEITVELHGAVQGNALCPVEDPAS
jgi:hypothetical protein